MEEPVMSHKQKETAKSFSNLQLSGGCVSLEERAIDHRRRKAAVLSHSKSPLKSTETFT